MSTELLDTIQRLNGAPMSLTLSDITHPTMTPESREADPALEGILQTAIDEYAQRFNDGAELACALCDVTWQRDRPTTIRCHGIGVLTTDVSFRTPGDFSPMLSFGICERCTEDQSTLAARVRDALAVIWPNLRSFPAASLSPMGAA